jgi:hypothetical protein
MARQSRWCLAASQRYLKITWKDPLYPPNLMANLMANLLAVPSGKSTLPNSTLISRSQSTSQQDQVAAKMRYANLKKLNNWDKGTSNNPYTRWQAIPIAYGRVHLKL